MGRTVNWSKTQPLRADQQRQFELVAARLVALTDDELITLSEEWRERVRELLHGKKGMDIDAYTGAFMGLADVLVTEGNYRQGVLWNVESEMQGGHRTHVTKDDKSLGMWRARCAPWWEYTEGEKPCWEGPERSYIEDTIEDARRHNPGHEPWHVEQ